MFSYIGVFELLSEPDTPEIVPGVLNQMGSFELEK
jgi:hypothetical protein